MMKKGQSALEYLITYGWAILIILVVLAVLWYYGVFDPNKWAGEQRYCSGDFELLGAEISVGPGGAGTLSVVLGNKVGDQVTINTLNVTGDATGTLSPALALQPGAQTAAQTITLAGLSATAGNMVSLKMDVAYTNNRLSLAGGDSCSIKITAK